MGFSRYAMGSEKWTYSLQRFFSFVGSLLGLLCLSRHLVHFLVDAKRESSAYATKDRYAEGYVLL
jgi:hypothetical protein